MDVEDLLAKQWSGKMKDSSSRFFTLFVEHVAMSTKVDGAFRVVGNRVDNNEKVVVYSQKAASLQAIPEVGGVMRADKAVSVANFKDIPSYKAEYYHAYGPDDFCMVATANPRKPYKQEADSNYSGQVDLIDHHVNATSLSLDNLTKDRIVAALLPHLRPWANTNRSPITHDIKGESIWQTPLGGLSPFVEVRLGNNGARVYGVGAKKDVNGNFVLPTDEKIIENIKSNDKLNALLSIIASNNLSSEQLSKASFFIYPGVAIKVGKDSLAGDKEKYLAMPERFTYDTEKGGKARGWRQDTIAHLKRSRTDRMMVVDLVPRGSSILSRFIPRSQVENEHVARKMAAQQQGAPTTSDALHQQNENTVGSQAQHQDEQGVSDHASAQKAAPQRTESHNQNTRINEREEYPDPDTEYGAVDHDVGVDADAYDEYAHDMAVIESLNGDIDSNDDDFERLMREAEEKVASRNLNSNSLRL